MRQSLLRDKILATEENDGKTLAIMNSEQANPRRCGNEKAGDALTPLSVMNRHREELSRQNVTMFRPDPIF